MKLKTIQEVRRTTTTSLLKNLLTGTIQTMINPLRREMKSSKWKIRTLERIQWIIPPGRMAARLPLLHSIRSRKTQRILMRERVMNPTNKRKVRKGKISPNTMALLFLTTMITDETTPPPTTATTTQTRLKHTMSQTQMKLGHYLYSPENWNQPISQHSMTTWPMKR